MYGVVTVSVLSPFTVVSFTESFLRPVLLANCYFLFHSPLTSNCGYCIITKLLWIDCVCPVTVITGSLSNAGSVTSHCSDCIDCVFTKLICWVYYVCLRSTPVLEISLRDEPDPPVATLVAVPVCTPVQSPPSLLALVLRNPTATTLTCMLSSRGTRSSSICNTRYDGV